LRPAQQRRQHLAGLVGVVVDRLLAEDDEIGLSCATSFFSSLATASGSTMPSTLTRMPRSAPMASPVRIVSAACCRADRDHDHLGRLAGFLQRSASSTAISSKGFIDIFTLASSTPEPSAFTRIFTL
jgi:hypothetical protein